MKLKMNKTKTKFSFKLVETKEEFDIFKEIWLTICDEKNFESDPFKEEATRYLIVDNETGEYIGTLEITPYDEETSAMEYYLEFGKLPYIRANKDRVYEIDKVCVKEEYRKRGTLKSLVMALIYHGLKYNTKYYISVTESIFYDALKKTFDIVPLDKDLNYEGFSLIASVFNFEENVKNGKLDRWIKKIEEEYES